MGLCLTLDHENDDSDVCMSYSTFYAFRQIILNAIEKGLGDEYSKDIFTNEEWEKFETKLKKYKINNFVLHSDCDGTLSVREIKRSYEAMKDLDISSVTDNEFFLTEFQRLKHLMQKAIKTNSKIIFC